MIKLTSFIVILITCLVITACVTDGSKEGKNVETSTPKRKANTSELAQRLYQNFHDNPVHQWQKEENLLIDYAMDKNLDVTRTESGLYYLITKEGKGPNYIQGQPCRANYKGYTLDGKIFDSSFKRNKPIGFNVGGMIAGWNEAIKLMNTGSAATLLIPSRLAYGEKGFPGAIAPNTPLVFEMEIVPLTDK